MLDNTFNNNFTFNMIGAPSFKEPYLCKQPPVHFPPKIRSSTSVNCYLPIPPLLVHKLILTIPTNSSFLYTSPIFDCFCVLPSQQSTRKIFSHLSFLANLGCVKGPAS